MKEVTKAQVVTIFGAPIDFKEGMSLKFLHNDFTAVVTQALEKEKKRREDQLGGKRQSLAERRKSKEEEDAAAAIDTFTALPHPGLATRCAIERERENIPDVRADESVDGYHLAQAQESRFGFESLACLVIPVVHMGELVGVIQLTNKEPPEPDEGPPELAQDGSEDPTTERLLFGERVQLRLPNEDDEDEEEAKEPPPPPPPSFSADDEAAACRLLGIAALLLMPGRKAVQKDAEIAAGVKVEQQGGKAEHPSPQPVRRAGAPTAAPSGAPAKAAPRRRPSNAPPLTTLPNAATSIEAITTIAKEVSRAATLRALLTAVLRGASNLVPTQHASVFVAGEDDGSMVRAAQPHDELGKAMPTELDVTRIPDARAGIVGRVLMKNEIAMVAHAPSERDFDRVVDSAPGYVINSVLCAPVVGASGRVLAAILLCNKVDPKEQKAAGGHATPEEFSPLDESALVLLTSMFAPALERHLEGNGLVPVR